VAALMPLLETLQRAGLDSRVVLRETGIELDLCADPSRRLPVRTSDAVWVAVEARLGPELPLQVARTVSPSSYGHLTYLLACAPTVGIALRLLERRYALLSDATSHRLEISGKRARLHVDLRGGSRPGCVEAFAVGVVRWFLHHQTSGRFSVGRVALTQSSPVSCVRAAYSRGLAHTMEYAAPWCGIEFDRSWLDVRFDRADPGLLRLLDAHAELLIHGESEANIVMRVRDHILARGARLGLRSADVAGELGMSDRTLRRRLAGAATSFQAVLDEALREAADRLLDEGRVEDVAAALGYSEAAAFRRAYRRWSGATPRVGFPMR